MGGTDFYGSETSRDIYIYLDWSFPGFCSSNYTASIATQYVPIGFSTFGIRFQLPVRAMSISRSVNPIHPSIHQGRNLGQGLPL